MFGKRLFVTFVALVGFAVLTPLTASAVVLIDFGYTSLDGAFDGASLFTATGDANSTGTVQREVAPIGTPAWFNIGTLNGQVIFSMNISNVTGGNVGDTADGAGTFTLTDADADTIAGNLAGTWTLNVSQANLEVFTFVGMLSNIYITSDDSTFDGATSGSWSTDFSGYAVEPYNGFIISLSVEFTGSAWFDNGAYSGAVTDATGKIIPAPGAVVLGVIGLGLVGRMKRWLS